jgi:hypothetical protein
VKRSRSITLLFAGGLAAGALAGCGPEVAKVSEPAVYPNNHQIPGAGFYHAPFRAFFPRRYNEYDAARKMYYYGGTWNAAPHTSIVNVSAPTAQAVQAAQAARSDITRGGFGRTGTNYSSFSS